MSNWLIIVGYDFLAGNWKNCSGIGICDKKVENCSVNVKHSIGFQFQDYYLVLVTTEGEINQGCYEKLLQNIKANKDDNIIIFCHEFRNGHRYGSTESTMIALQANYKNLRFRLFPGGEDDKSSNYPFWLAIQINEFLGENKTQSKWRMPTWVELEKEAEKKSLIKPLSILKHRIIHMFSPVDNDLQMLWDESVMAGRKGLNPERWMEIVNIYKDMDWKTNICEALELIENFIEKDLTEDKKQKANEISDFIKNTKVLMKCDRQNELDHAKVEFIRLLLDAYTLLELLKNGKMNDVYKVLESKKGLNPVHEWLVKLDDMLEELIKEEDIE